MLIHGNINVICHILDMFQETCYSLDTVHMAVLFIKRKIRCNIDAFVHGLSILLSLSYMPTSIKLTDVCRTSRRIICTSFCSEFMQV